MRRHVTVKKKKKKKSHLGTLLLDDGGSDHLVEGIVFAFAGRCNVHGGGANVLLLEAGLEQMWHLCLLKIINRRSRSVWGYQVPSDLFIINLEIIAALNSGCTQMWRVRGVYTVLLKHMLMSHRYNSTHQWLSDFTGMCWDTALTVL